MAENFSAANACIVDQAGSLVGCVTLDAVELAKSAYGRLKEKWGCTPLRPVVEAVGRALNCTSVYMDATFLNALKRLSGELAADVGERFASDCASAYEEMRDYCCGDAMEGMVKSQTVGLFTSAGMVYQGADQSTGKGMVFLAENGRTRITVDAPDRNGLYSFWRDDRPVRALVSFGEPGIPDVEVNSYGGECLVSDILTVLANHNEAVDGMEKRRRLTDAIVEWAKCRMAGKRERLTAEHQRGK